MSTAKWRTYEEVAEFLLRRIQSHIGLTTVEGKQMVAGKSTVWEVDAKGFREGGDGIVLIECRRHTSRKLDQESIGAFAFRIQDTASEAGIVVSPMGLQEGAQRVAEAHNIVSVRLDADSTTSDYMLRFLNQVFVGMSSTVHLTARSKVEVISRRAVLVVDDEEADRLTMGTILEQAGFDVRRAGSVQGAALTYVQDPVDVLVTDIVMREGDGVDLIEGLRRLRPNLPIVAVSGKGPAGLAAAKAMGATRILTKPVEPKELIQAVRELAEDRER